LHPSKASNSAVLDHFCRRWRGMKAFFSIFEYFFVERGEIMHELIVFPQYLRQSVKPIDDRLLPDLPIPAHLLVDRG
jgi:hypothetical protein